MEQVIRRHLGQVPPDGIAPDDPGALHALGMDGDPMPDGIGGLVVVWCGGCRTFAVPWAPCAGSKDMEWT